MDERPYRVDVVVDPFFGERIRSIPVDEPAWIVDSLGNHPVIQSIWQERKERDVREGITSFKFDPDAGPEDWLITQLGVIDLHHGEFSHDPPYSVLNIVGVRWSERIQRELNGFGFDRWEATAEGFISVRDLTGSIQ
jgi:hypothetical protein